MKNQYLCTLYNCKSENKLSQYLLLPRYKYNRIKYQSYNNPLSFYKLVQNEQNREMFSGNNTIRNIHKRLVKLYNVDAMPYIKSGIKKQSSITNAKEHINSNFFLFLDIKSFYPSITKEIITKRLILDYKHSKDVATFIANITTVPQEKIDYKRALVTGSPLSQHFIYVLNKKMFDELYILAKQENMKFTVYVDDIAFSSNIIIPHTFFQKVFNIINQYQLRIHKNKTFRGTYSSKSHITGVQITKYGFRLMKKHKVKIKELIVNIRKTNSEKDKQSLLGLIQYAVQVNEGYKKYLHIIKKSDFIKGQGKQ